MSAQLAFLQRVGLHGGTDVKIRVSDRRILQDYLAQHDITDDRFAACCVIVDKLAKIGPDNTAELLRNDVHVPDTVINGCSIFLPLMTSTALPQSLATITLGWSVFVSYSVLPQPAALPTA